VDRGCEVRVGACADGRGVLHLSGELDMTSDGDVIRAVESLSAAGARVVVVDVHELDFIDSSGLGILIRAADRVRSDLGQLVIDGAGGPIRRVFELAGLTEMLTAERHD
jgi:anti-sigma B factor antagonist